MILTKISSPHHHHHHHHHHHRVVVESELVSFCTFDPMYVDKMISDRRVCAYIIITLSGLSSIDPCIARAEVFRPTLLHRYPHDSRLHKMLNYLPHKTIASIISCSRYIFHVRSLPRGEYFQGIYNMSIILVYPPKSLQLCVDVHDD